MKRRSITIRTAERLHRAAYEYEALAARFKQDGYDGFAGSIREISSRFGNLARSLDDILADKKD